MTDALKVDHTIYYSDEQKQLRFIARILAEMYMADATDKAEYRKRLIKLNKIKKEILGP